MILIDCNGSMVPFPALSARLVDVASVVSDFVAWRPTIFTQTPEDQFYPRHLQDPERLESLFAGGLRGSLQSQSSAMEGGSGRISSTRIEDSERFLTELRRTYVASSGSIRCRGPMAPAQRLPDRGLRSDVSR